MGESWFVLGIVLVLLGAAGLASGQVYISIKKKKIKEESERIQGEGF